MVFQLLYVSEKSKHFKEEDVDLVIEKSRTKNKIKNISGILICNGDFFIQLLEGEKESVLERYNIISNDNRHYRVRTLFTNSASCRIFPEWSMGLVKDPPKSTMAQIFHLLQKNLSDEKEVQSKILTALKKFNRLGGDEIKSA